MKFEEIDGSKHEAEKAEKTENEIKELFEALNNFDFNLFDEQIQEEWYWVEQEAEVALDRTEAKTHLEEFVNKLKSIVLS